MLAARRLYFVLARSQIRLAAPALGLRLAALAWGRQLAALALGLALLCSSCTTTPTLPLPPPLASVGTPDSEGFASVEGQGQALAFVLVLNEASEEGVITRANNEGNFKTRIAAKAGDLLTIWQEIGDGEQSDQKHVSVPAPR